MIGSSERPVGRALLHCLISSAIVLGCAVAPVSAQDVASARDGWIVGPLVGVPGAGRESAPQLFTFGVGGTRLVPNRPGVDFAIGVVPRGLVDGVIVLGARAGLGLPLALNRDVFLIPSAGVSAVGGLGTEGGGGAVGAYGGAAAVLAVGSVGFRAGVTLHRFSQGNGTFWLAEVGIMHVPLLSLKRTPSE